MKDILQIISWIISIGTGSFALLVTISKPFRNRFLKSKKQREREKREEEDRRETDLCLLRDRILSFYYKHHQSCEIRQYEFENVELLYTQYKKLGGNAFVEKIWEEMQEWRIIS